jgi:hypothetical protein
MSTRRLWRMTMKRNGWLPRSTSVTGMGTMDSTTAYLIHMGSTCLPLFGCRYRPSVPHTVCNPSTGDAALTYRQKAQVVSERNSSLLAWARICVMSSKRSFRWKRNSLLMNRAMIHRLRRGVGVMDPGFNPLGCLQLYLIDLHEHLPQ